MTRSGTELLEAYSAAVGSRTPGNRCVTYRSKASERMAGHTNRSKASGRMAGRTSGLAAGTVHGAGSDARPPRTFDTECPPQSRLFRRPLATTLLALWLARGVLWAQETAASKVQAG